MLMQRARGFVDKYSVENQNMRIFNTVSLPLVLAEIMGYQVDDACWKQSLEESRYIFNVDGGFYPIESLGKNTDCRLITSWGCSRSQGYGCSPFKVVRELGLERRETVRSLSAVGAGELRGAAPSTRGPEWTHHWCSGCHANGTAR